MWGECVCMCARDIDEVIMLLLLFAFSWCAWICCNTGSWWSTAALFIFACTMTTLLLFATGWSGLLIGFRFFVLIFIALFFFFFLFYKIKREKIKIQMRRKKSLWWMLKMSTFIVVIIVVIFNNVTSIVKCGFWNDTCPQEVANLKISAEQLYAKNTKE